MLINKRSKFITITGVITISLLGIWILGLISDILSLWQGEKIRGEVDRFITAATCTPLKESLSTDSETQIPKMIHYHISNEQGQSSDQSFPTYEMKHFQRGNCWVIFEEELQPVAQYFFDYIRFADGFIREKFDVLLKNRGAVFISGKVPKQAKYSDEEAPRIYWVSDSLKEMKESNIQEWLSKTTDIYWSYLLGSVHITLLHTYLGKPLDRRARWLGDGLSEYFSYTSMRVFSLLALKEEMSYLRDLVNEFSEFRDSYYDLTQYEYKTKPVGRYEKFKLATGRSIALSFWLYIADRYSENIIKEFLARLKVSPKPVSHETALKILSELTSEDVSNKLQFFYLSEARKILEAHLNR